MILESKTDTILLEEGEDVQESTNMEIDADSHIFLMRMLSKFYSDGVGSSIRETTSNALDSHRACGVKEPIIVAFKKNKDGNYEFSVQDFGCGLDDIDIETIIKKYGKSTKRGSNSQIGCYGLGFKSPLAYTSSFYFIGRKNGIERKWMLYESDDENNKIDLLYESETTERNGVKVIIPVKWADAHEFHRKIRQQLAYFEDVYFDCESSIDNNSIKIVRSEHFQWSSLCSDNKLHLCLDNVYYPIDFDKLGISSIHFPVALRFSLKDGIFPVPNREQLKYTKEAKEIIKNKIAKIADYFVSKYNESIKDTDDVFPILSYYSDNSRNIPHFSGIGHLSVKNIEPYSTMTFTVPKLNGIKLLDMKKVYEMRDYLLGEYKTIYTLSNGRFNGLKNAYSRSRHHIDEVDRGSVYSFTELSILKRIYLRETLGYGTKLFVRKEKKIPLGEVKYRYTGRGLDSYVNILQLFNHPKSQWRERIQEWQYIVSLTVKKIVDVDKIEIPKEWLENRKKQRVQNMISKGTDVRRKKLTGEVSGKVARNLEKYVAGKNCKFVPNIYQMKEAHKNKKFLIYGGLDSESLLQKLYKIIDRKKVELAIFSERELKNLKEINLHNWMEISKFMEGKHKVYRRIVTAYLINKLHKKHNSVFSKIENLKKISRSLGDKVKILNDYNDNHNFFREENDEILIAMLKLAEEHKLFDNSIYSTYKEVEFILGKLPFINVMFDAVSYSAEDEDEDEMMKAIRDLFKYHKQRIDWQHYNLPINNEIEENKELTEKTI